ncbi:MAG: ABC transporter permease subunit [Chloroflexi bacterium]|nr:ABC transporter permease subunit [Chloroflexota bacterium]
MNKTTQMILRTLLVLLVVAAAFGLRTYAANTLSIDYDEDDYLRAGQEFAHFIRTSNWRGFLETNYRPEHPQLAKIMFGLSILGLPEEPLIADVPITANPARSLPPDLLRAARTMSTVWGTTTAFLLALMNPLGGLLLAIHSFTVKYTSQVMLDGFAALMSTATALTYYFSKRQSGKKKNILLIGSAIFLGMSASSKYLHSAVGFAILIDWFISAKESNELKKYFRNAVLWGMLAILVFFLCNPFYWADPVGSIRITYEAVTATTTNPNVENANYPMWQQLMHLSMSVPISWNPDSFPVRADGLIFIFALIGIAKTWKKDRFIAIWLFVDIFFLLVWRTKWAQYILVATVPLSFAAAEGLKESGRLVAGWWRDRRRQREEAVKPSRKEILRALPWLVPGLVAFALLTLVPLFFQVAISLTDFNVTSLRDGLNGGIWRAIWGGLTGEVPATTVDFGARANKVNFIGLGAYPVIFRYISGSFTTWNILFFDTFWTVLSVLLQSALGLGTALLLWQRGLRLGKFWQAVFILPWAIPEMIGALLWLNIFTPDTGWLALAVKDFGENIPFGFFNNWNQSADLWLVVFLLAAMWYGFPFMMLASSVGLKMIPRDVYDAAAMDGASAGQTFRFITWPLLYPLLVPAMIVRAIFSFNQFYLFQTFFFGNATLATESYNIFNPSGAFGAQGQFSFSAVINVIAVIVLMILVLLFNRWSKAGEGVTYA